MGSANYHQVGDALNFTGREIWIFSLGSWIEYFRRDGTMSKPQGDCCSIGQLRFVASEELSAHEDPP